MRSDVAERGHEAIGARGEAVSLRHVAWWRRSGPFYCKLVT
jgi:hypothetical protein